MSNVISISEDSLRAHTVLPAEHWPDNAVSPEAQLIANAMAEVNEEFEHSEALFGDKAAVISELDAIADECRVENWDGEGASPIDPWAVRTAQRLVRVLPEGVPVPECAPEPDGSISLDWIDSLRRVFSISVGGDLRLAYAWLDGSDKGHAVARFDKVVEILQFRERHC